MLNATYRVQDVTFSKDRRRVATGHGNRYVQLWDLDGDTYKACESDGLFMHRPGKGGLAACLRGHAKEVEAISFAAGDPDRLLSVSADQSDSYVAGIDVCHTGIANAEDPGRVRTGSHSSNGFRSVAE